MTEPAKAPLYPPEKPPPTLEELYRQAKADLAHPGPDTVTKWVFLHAKAAGRREVAERRWKLLSDRSFLVHSHAATLAGQIARDMVTENDVDPIEWHKADVAVTDAVEECTATAKVLELLSRQPRLQAMTGGRR